MLTLLQHTTSVPQSQFPSLEALLDEPFPRTPEDLLQLEQRLSTAAVQVADQIVLVQLTRAHEDEAFVRQAIAHVRAQSPVPLVHKGFRTTSVLLLGGTRLVLETPYLREDRRAQTVPSLPLLWWGIRATLPCKPQHNEKPCRENENAAECPLQDGT